MNFRVVAAFLLASAGAFAQAWGGAVPAPTAGAYLGAWVNPNGTSAYEEQETEHLEASIGRTFALHLHYYGWTALAGFPDADITADASHGRTPVVTWACGDLNSNVAAGADDALIRQTASAMKAWGKPVLLRWYWEMNLVAGKNGQSCMDSSGAAGYIAAWRHIHDVFQSAGATNVAFLWNPAGGAADLMQYYPGAAYVDWVGTDEYPGVNNGVLNTDFSRMFNQFYSNYAPLGKPLIVGETAELEQLSTCAYTASAEAQAAFLDSMANALQAQYPQVAAVDYFDAHGSAYSGCSWALDGAGITALAAIGKTAYFKP